jgi:hypothetical protein
MTATLAAPAPQTPIPERPPTPPAPPVALERRHWLAAVAMLVVLFAPYQTLVQTVTTDDAVRKGIEADDYQMTLTLGLVVTCLLWWAARGLRAPPGAGYA